ncbi:MAG: hypothetical protein GX155_08205 [Smithella sp.]|nr:hypothetical protein [Smithella sp.]
MAHIQIVTLPDEVFLPYSLIGKLSEIWREQGHKISVGPLKTLEADIGIVHMDRTWIATDRLPENPLRRPFLNSSILDISKRRISRNLLTRDSNYSGPVMVKTNANYFGWPERFSSASKIERRLYLMLMKRKISWRWTRLFLPGSYAVLEGAQQVPAWVWTRDDLVVEKFLPEKEGDEYALRVWVFFGPQEYCVRMFSPSPVVKATEITHYDYIDDVPDSVREARRGLGVDFGKFDYVMVNGEAVLLDVNKTPTMAARQRGDGHSPNMLKLSSGLEYFLEGAK